MAKFEAETNSLHKIKNSKTKQNGTTSIKLSSSKSFC